MNLQRGTVAIIATGPSMSPELAASLASPVIAVNNAFALRPDAIALVANDAAFWRAHPEALAFPGKKCSVSQVPGVDRVTPEGPIGTGTNSGALALYLAIRWNAGRVLLYGVDLHGTHYFGPHVAPLKNTTPGRFEVFKLQFARIRDFARRQKVEVWNCSPMSALRCFPKMPSPHA